MKNEKMKIRSRNNKKSKKILSFQVQMSNVTCVCSQFSRHPTKLLSSFHFHGSGASVLLTWYITVDAAMQELMRQNAEFLMQLQQQNLQAFQQLIEQMRANSSGVK